MTFRVTFQDVGPRKQTWTDTLRRLDHSSLLRSIRGRHALASRGIDFAVDDETGHGDIYAGGFRNVGTFRFEAADD
jgi:hypothetical protein